MKVSVILTQEQIKQPGQVQHVIGVVLLRAIMRNLEESTKLLSDPPADGLEFQFSVRPHAWPASEPEGV